MDHRADIRNCRRGVKRKEAPFCEPFIKGWGKPIWQFDMVHQSKFVRMGRAPSWGIRDSQRSKEIFNQAHMIVPVIEEAKVPLIGIFTGAEFLREPVKKYVFNIRFFYYEETAGIIDNFWNELGLRKIAVLYQNDAFGEAGLKGVELALQKYNSQPVATGSYERGTSNTVEALTSIRKTAPEAVVMISTYGPSVNFIRSAKWSGMNPYFHNLSVVGAQELIKQLGVGRDSQGVIVTQVVPPPESDIPGVQEYRKLLKKYYPEDMPNFVSLEGFVNAKVLVEILKQAGPDITREGFIQAAESLKDFDTQCDSKITYSPTDHRGIEKLYFTVFDKKQYSIIEDWKKLTRF